MAEGILVAATVAIIMGILFGLFEGKMKTKTLMHLSAVAIVAGLALFIFALSGGVMK